MYLFSSELFLVFSFNLIRTRSSAIEHLHKTLPIPYYFKILIIYDLLLVQSFESLHHVVLTAPSLNTVLHRGFSDKPIRTDDESNWGMPIDSSVGS
jgi:hypothetical protein